MIELIVTQLATTSKLIELVFIPLYPFVQTLKIVRQAFLVLDYFFPSLSITIIVVTLAFLIEIWTKTLPHFEWHLSRSDTSFFNPTCSVFFSILYFFGEYPGHMQYSLQKMCACNFKRRRHCGTAWLRHWKHNQVSFP